MGCKSCNKNLIKAKLGRCQSCMITALVCTILGLVGHLLTADISPLTTAIIALRLFATTFTALFALHAIYAIYYKVTGNLPDDNS